jgi:phosphinothricin acetyltransferase
MIRLATTADAIAIAAIYNHYVTSTTVTFEEQGVTQGEMASRIESVGARLPWYVYEQGGEVIGYPPVPI